MCPYSYRKGACLDDNEGGALTLESTVWVGWALVCKLWDHQ